MPALLLIGFPRFLLNFGFFRYFISYLIMIAENGCAADVPPRWAFVCGLLRRYVRQRGVLRRLFFFVCSRINSFIFFVVAHVKTAFILRGVLWILFQFIPTVFMFFNRTVINCFSFVKSPNTCAIEMLQIC